MKNRLSISLLALKDFSRIDEFLSLLQKNKIKYIELPITKILPNTKWIKRKLKIF
jgi:hypothetical protein